MRYTFPRKVTLHGMHGNGFARKICGHSSARNDNEQIDDVHALRGERDRVIGLFVRVSSRAAGEFATTGSRAANRVMYGGYRYPASKNSFQPRNDTGKRARRPLTEGPIREHENVESGRYSYRNRIEIAKYFLPRGDRSGARRILSDRIWSSSYLDETTSSHACKYVHHRIENTVGR